ncbi:helix-turn-helix domain-containing protein [Streptomyces coeruleorubidus]|uniref:helix-turn-helix domain-containing protein n=1 Tax=Streptomyces coeruleorubidus TaxID=116188 RepID=UPI0033B85AB5
MQQSSATPGQACGQAVGAGAKHQLVFVNRLLATLVHLRHSATHDVLACWFGVDCSAITRAIGEARPLLAERGCTVSPGVRLRALAQVIDGTEIRLRRPAAVRKERDKFIAPRGTRRCTSSNARRIPRGVFGVSLTSPT